MLVFVTTAAHGYTVSGFLQSRANGLGDRVITLSYGELLSWPKLPAGNYIFADVDRLLPDESTAVAMRIEALRRALPMAKLLNHPLRSLGRLALLDALHTAGINRYRACRATQPAADLRYPLFVRTEVEHSGALTPLLQSPQELATALARLQQDGVNLSECLVIEFIDVRNAEGLFEKYSVLRVGDTLFATDLSVNTGWICKGEDDEYSDAGWLARDLEFQRACPHIDQLRPIFEAAAIEYGRVDYGFSNGALQVFEINSNPMVLAPDAAHPEHRPSYASHAQNYNAAMKPLTQPVGARYWVTVEGAVGSIVIDANSALRRMVRRLLRSWSALHHEPQAGRGLQMLKNALSRSNL